MATEAQRLMMMSLGKIQGCRQQRGGINLYKSLLVSKVLYRARSVALSEHTSPKEEQDQCVPEVVMQPQSETCTEKSEETHVDYDDHTQDKENTRPVESPSRHNKPLCSQDGFRNLENKPVNQERAARCVKRRLTEVEQAVESISPKKQKLEDTQAHAHEPMQVELSSLVNRFSSTFTGLLTTDTDNFTGEDSTGEEGHGHTSGETSLLSCSTQIKESFELLVRPIALSV